MLRHLATFRADEKLPRLVACARRALHTKQVQNLAQTGEGLKDVEIIEWFVKPGDLVSQYDMLCRVHSDKATIDVTSAYDGKIDYLSSQVGEIVAVGDPLCTFSTLDGETKESDETQEEKV